MIRNLKVMGLALVAVFALGAVAASAASAQVGTLTSDGPVTLVGTQTGAFGSGANALTATFGGTANKVECEKATYAGHKYNVTPHTFIPNDVSTVTITPSYGTCKWFAGAASGPATVDMNGCDYVFHLGETTGTDKYAVSSTVICPETKKITVTLFTNATEHTNNKPFCHITIIHKATDYTGAEVSNTTEGAGAGTVDLTGPVTGIKAEKTGGGVLCPTNVDENAKLDLDVNVEGKNEAGGKTNISISHL